MALTDFQIKNLKYAGKPMKIADGGGLYLYLSASGKKLWRMSYYFERKEKVLSFGEYPVVTLQKAREKRLEAKQLLADGIDPAAKRKIAKEEQISEVKDMFRNIALEWFEARTTDFTEKHRGTVMYRMEKYIFPVIGEEHIARMEALDILKVIQPIEKKGQNETARRLLQIIGQIYRFAVITGRAKRNPVTDLSGAIRPRNVTHRAAITEPKKVAQLLRNIDAYEGYFPIVCALKLAPLVFVRPTELRAAEWTEFDFETNEWRIPATRMKMKQMHIVPLSRQAVAILKELQEFSGNGKLLFPSIRTATRPLADATVLNAIRRMGYTKDEMCTHGFRSLASTLLNELGYNRDWIERQLAHGERNDVRAAYNYAEYLPQRTKMMQEWADFLDKLKAEK
ncbi:MULTISPECIES: tyrosine-type recombinase/integrase [unclassified Desulfovibrio]|uniref:tyrosine-type recombinase/integrase n=1 Tax=unclassified Desulfovibrio TaxID=2593640 RepID=UPI002FD91158